MTRRTTVLRLTATFVGIVALAFVAATLPETMQLGGEGNGDGGVLTLSPEQQDGIYNPDRDPIWLQLAIYVVIALVTISLAWFLLFDRIELVRMAATTAVLVFVVSLILYGLFHGRGGPEAVAELITSGTEPDPNQTDDGGGTGGGPDDTRDQLSIPIQTLVVAVGLIATIFVGAMAFTRRTDTDEIQEMEPDEDESVDTTQLGQAARRAVNRIESAGELEALDNAVYRAWAEMTVVLDMEDPQTTTPGEFAAAAVDAGMVPADVSELTELFEAVRYGAREPTPELEARSLEILRRIEATYIDESDPESLFSGDA